jgi:hypothetical protein
MPLSLITPATTTVQFMLLKATELQLHDELPQGGRFAYNSLLSTPFEEK